MNARILNHPYTIRHASIAPHEHAVGLHYPPTAHRPGRIIIQTGLHDPLHLSTLIHEFLHAADSSLSETRIDHLASVLGRLIRECGYARPHPLTEPT